MPDIGLLVGLWLIGVVAVFGSVFLFGLAGLAFWVWAVRTGADAIKNRK